MLKITTHSAISESFSLRIVLFVLVVIYCGEVQGQEARVFAEEFLSSHDNFALTFAPDGKTVYFTRGQIDGGGLFESKLENGRWLEPKQVSFSFGKYNDNDLFVSPDGSKYFFMSKRPTVGTNLKKEQDIWMVEKIGNKWGNLQHLGQIVNSKERDGFPSVTKNGSLYFFSERKEGFGSSDIYRARFVNGKYVKPENLGPVVNSKHWDGLPYIAPDASFLIFFSTRPGGYGKGDLYVSYCRKGVWTAPENLGPSVNSAESDVTPHISPDGKYLFFARRSGVGGRRSIYYIDVEKTPLSFDKKRFQNAFKN